MSEANTSNLVEYAQDGHIVTLSLNRPEKLNAFSDELVMAPLIDLASMRHETQYTRLFRS